MHLKNNNNKIKQKRNTQLKDKLPGIFKLNEQKTLKVNISFWLTKNFKISPTIFPVVMLKDNAKISSRF